MKRTTFLAVALVCLGATSLILSTSAQRQPAPAPPEAAATAAAQSRPARQDRTSRRLPETRENFDIRAGHLNSLAAPDETARAGAADQATARGTQTSSAARYKLQRTRPSLRMQWSSLSGAPSRVWSFSEALTAPSAADPEVIARRFLKDNDDLFQLRAAEVDGLQITRRYRTDHNGLTHITLGQQLNGIEVFQADFAVHVDEAGAVLAASGELIPGAARKVNLAQPKLTAAEGLQIAARDVGAQITGALELRVLPNGAQARQEFDRSAGFGRAVQARLVYFPLAAEQLRLAWEFIVEMRETPDVYLLVIDAERGTPLYRYNFTCYDENPLRPHGLVFTGESPRPNLPQTGANPAVVVREDVPFRATPYNGREIFAISDPRFDWWTGVPANNLISNNTNTYLDRDGTPNQPDLPRLMAADGNFSFPVDLTQAPTTPDNQRAAQANLFYWVNRYHDILYSFGFNEAAGNFQTNLFGQVGRGNDAVNAEVQDGGGTNNANFSTPPDGMPGRVQMYLWTGTPQRDGDLDQSIIVHELTHGLTNRLVSNASGLTGVQSRGMGEGWSDWFGLVLLAREGDDLNGGYAIGQFATNNYLVGIRRYSYSTNQTIFPLTFRDIALSNLVHDEGEIWCAALWEMRSLLIQRYGFREGQRQSIQLVVDGLKLTPRAPTFVDARNAIFLADRVNNRGANQCVLWQAFSKRGLGFDAETTDASDGTPTESLLIAPYCSDAGLIRLNKSQYVPNETLRISLGDRNATGTVRVVVTSSVSGDQELLTLTPDAVLAGSFTGALRLTGGRARASDGVLQGTVDRSDQIIVAYNDANAGGGVPVQTRATANFARERTLFNDTVEEGNQGWLPTGTWGMTNARAASPTRAWTDTPAGNYTDNSNTWLTSPLYDLTGLSEVILSFAHSYDLEPSFDFGLVEFSIDDGTTWRRAVSFTGTQGSFTQAQVRLPGLDGQARARVRFRLTSDVSIVGDGWYIDDIRISGRSVSPTIITPGSAQPPAITSVTPAFGPPAGGTRVTIIGANFTDNDDTQVTFDNLPAAAIDVVSGTVITAVTPPHAAGAVTVRVGTREGAVSLVKGFTYYTAGSASAAPVLTSLYPTFGSLRGGTVVTLVGANFTPETVVTFGTARGAVTFVNANTLRVATPFANATGAVDVTAANGAAQARMAGGFNYINPTPPTVEVISPSGGERLYVGSTVTLRWRSSDNRALARHRLSLRRGTGLSFTLTDIVANLEGAAQSYAWTIPANLAGAEGRLRVLATDDEGTETEAYSGNNFVIARRWEAARPLPTPISSFAAASDGRYLYRIGGTVLVTGSPLTATVQRLDPTVSAAVWADVAPLPTALTTIDAVFLKGKIYLPGGIDPTIQRITRHFVYDGATNAWTTQADAPASLSSYVLVADEAHGVYYRTGGFTTTGRVTAVHMFNPDTNTWSALPPLGTARNFHEAALIEGKLYVAGGLGNTGGLASAEVYDFSTRQWTEIAPLNRPRSLATSFVTRDPSGNPLWVVVGGNDPVTGALLGAEVYDVRNNRWITLDNSFALPTPRAVLGGATLGNFFYAYGSNAIATGAANERIQIDSLTPIPFDPVAPALTVPATQLAVAGVELKFPVTANDLGSGVPIAITAQGLPAGASFTTAAATNNSVRGTFRWTPAPSDTGRSFTVSFTASDGQLSDIKLVNIRVVAASPAVAVNAADFRSGPLAADSIAALFGVNLAVRAETAGELPLPLELAGTTVTINGVLAPLFYVSPTQLNFAVPSSIEPGTATLIVSNPAGSYAVSTVEIVPAAPALFTLNAAGTGEAWALATVDGVNYQAPPFDVLVNGRPNILVLQATGVRHALAANPNDDDGVAEAVSATIDGRAARVLFAGAQGNFTGLDQLNVEMPASLAGTGPRSVEVVITVSGMAANRVTIRIK